MSDPGAGANFTASCQLAFQSLDPLPDSSDSLTSASAAVLRALNALDEGLPREASEPQQQFLRQLDGKVTLLMQMVAQLLSDQGKSLPFVTACLSATSVTWSGQGDPPRGSGILTLVLSPAIAVPVRLPLRIVDVESQPDRRWRATGELVGLPADCQDAWDHFVFRHHRREVAARRG